LICLAARCKSATVVGALGAMWFEKSSLSPSSIADARRWELLRCAVWRRFMLPAFQTSDADMREACAQFWHTYFHSMMALHLRQGRSLDVPTKNRNLGTTASRHVHFFEEFWREQLAEALGVKASEVGPRTIRFRPYRSKKFDVCWPLKGEPKILISIKSMQNAYRNFTNRIEEALGDSAVLRLYRLRAAFGFFFFMLDGNVPRGRAEPGAWLGSHAATDGGKSVAPFLEVIEEGGDFFNLKKAAEFRKQAIGQGRGRQDVIVLAEQSLLDLIAADPSRDGAIHYDAVAFLPTRIKRLKALPKSSAAWAPSFSPVDARLDFHPFVSRLIEVADFRGII
jgi:hypothetical protein